MYIREGRIEGPGNSEQISIIIKIIIWRFHSTQQGGVIYNFFLQFSNLLIRIFVLVQFQMFKFQLMLLFNLVHGTVFIFKKSHKSENEYFASIFSLYNNNHHEENLKLKTFCQAPKMSKLLLSCFKGKQLLKSFSQLLAFKNSKKQLRFQK